jgi:protein-S-isoprenylcysteine O-methyltransferase Ste14
MKKLLGAAFFFFLLPAAILIYIPFLLVELEYVNPEPIKILYPLAIACWLGGTILCIWTIVVFWKIGEGTPAPNAPTQKLVDRGVYGITRNPMYLGAWIILLGYVFWYQSEIFILYTVVVGLFFHAIITLFEEPRLGKQFGEEYTAYRQRVPRWLIRTR